MTNTCRYLIALIIISLTSNGKNQAFAVCNPPDCNGKGTCNAATQACDCNPPFTGTSCETRDPCIIQDEDTGAFVPRDCGKDGKCVPLASQPLQSECQCNKGFYGDECQWKDICFFDKSGNPWPPDQPCGKGNICNSTKEIVSGKPTHKASCFCFSPQVGPRCQYLDPCYQKTPSDPHPCFGRGNCKTVYSPKWIPSKTCTCQIGWDSGTFCEKQDPCIVAGGTDSVCKNGARCNIDRTGSALKPVCICAPNYDGEFCERVNKCGIPAEHCNPGSNKQDCNPCLNGGICSSTLTPVVTPIPDYRDPQIRVHSCDCTLTTYHGQFCELLKTSVIIIPADHPGPYGTAHVPTFQATAGLPQLYYIVAIAFGNEGELNVDTGDGFQFKLSLEALKPIHKDNTVLEPLSHLSDQQREHGALFYPLWHNYKQGKYQMKVSILNGGSPSDLKVTDIDAVLPNGASCVPYSLLKNVGHLVEEATEYKRTDTFVVETSLMFDCFETEWLKESSADPPLEEEERKFRYEWKLYKLTHLLPSPSAENDWHVEKLANVSRKYLRFDNHCLIDGFYLVEYRALVKINGIEYGNSALGFFRINVSPPKIDLDFGDGHRTVDVDEEVVLNANYTVDQSFPDQSPFLKYTWTCTDPGCTLGPWDDSVVTIPKETLTFGSTVSIKLDVKSLHSKTQSTTNIILDVRTKAEVSVKCNRNCKFFNPGDEVIFECNYLLDRKPGPVKDIKWIWHPENELFPTSVQDEPYMISIILPPHSTVTPRSLECQVSPGVLPAVSARTENFEINTPPIPATTTLPPSGPCSVTPDKGTYLVTEFSVTCVRYDDDKLPLEYSFLVEVDPTSPYSKAISKLKNRLFLAHDTNPIADGLYLPFGESTSAFTVNIVVLVTDDLGLSVEIKIPVIVELPPASDFGKLYMQLIYEKDSLMRRKFLRGDYQGAMQLYMVALYGLQDPSIKAQLSVEAFNHTLQLIDNLIDNVPQHSFKANEQVLYTTHLMEYLQTYTDPDAIHSVSKPLHDTASNLVEFAKSANEVTSSKELETLADAVVDSGSRVLKASTQCASKVLTQPAVLYMCNERNVLDFDYTDDRNVDAYFESIEDDLTSDEKEDVGTVAESAEITVGRCSKSSRNAIRAVRGALDGAIGHLGVAISFDTNTDAVSGHTEIMSEDKSDVSIALQTDDPSQDTEVKIMIPGETLEVMQGRVDAQTTRLELQAITTTHNVFLDDTSACPTTSTVHFKVQDSEAHVPVLIKHLTEPIEISLPVHRPLTSAELDKGKSPVQEVEILPVDELDDYYELPTFQLFLPHNVKVIVKILDKTSDTMMFKVLPKKNRRPIFSDFCNNDEVIDVDPNSDVAVFHTDSIGLNEQPAEPFLDYHVSILVFDLHNSYREEKFTAVFSRYSCLFRDEDRKFWSEQGCMVSNETTISLTAPVPSELELSRIKCLCNHASIISGAHFISPVTVDHTSVITGFTLGDLERNPVVLITVCVLLILYLIALIICWIFDRRDAVQDVGLTIMADLQVKMVGTKFYLITVVTGCNFWAGTTSSVSLVIYGSAGRSDVFTLKDRTNTVFLRGDVDTFLISCDKDLGTLEKIRIWTDHTGIDPAWYCRKIMIRSITPDIAWHFYVNRWLTVTSEESTVILEIPATTKEEQKKFSVRYKENLLERIDNVNLWFSIFRYSPASNFTRCQRLSSAFAVLTSYLLFDIMYHGTPTEDDEGLWDFGEYTVDVYAIVKSIQIVCMGIPVGIVIVALFRNVRLRYMPTLIIWENAVPATADKGNLGLFFPSKERIRSKGKRKHVNLPVEGSDPKVFTFERSKPDDDGASFFGSGSEIDLNLHPDRMDRISKTSTNSKFSIPSTDVPKLENWIEDRVNEGDHSSGVHTGAETDNSERHAPPAHPPNKKEYPYVQPVDSQSAIKGHQGKEEQDTMFRLGRRAMIHSVRDCDPDTFIFQGDNDIPRVEELIDETIRNNQLCGRGNKPKGEGMLETASGGEEMHRKEIILGHQKEQKEGMKAGDKTPWKRKVTTEYLENIDHSLEAELANKQFMQDKANWESQIALEICRLCVDFKHKTRSSLPWWFVYIAWGVCITVIILCLTFTLLFGLHYGYLRSLQWLETLIWSFLISIFIMNPIQSLIYTFIITMFTSKRQKVQERLQVLIEDVKSTADYLSSQCRLPYKFNLFRPVRVCEPLRGNEIFRLTIQARRKKELRGKLIWLILCVLLLIPLIAVSYSGHNNYNYEIVQNIRNMFHLTQIDSEVMKFQTEASIYDYLENVVIHNLHPLRYPEGSKIPPNSPALLSDQQTLLIGVGRIRQQRVHPSACLPPLGAGKDFADPTNHVCNKGFRKATQDRETYNPLWEPITLNGNGNPIRYPISLTNDGWEFHSANSKRSQSRTFRGNQGIYDGGGYILELGRTRRQSLSVVRYMDKTRWLDHRTRAIFVELTLMNPNINKFVDVVIVIEQGSSGSFSISNRITPLQLIPFNELQKDDELGWITFCMVTIIVVLFLWICFFLNDVFKSPRGRRLRRMDFWLNLLIIILVFSCLMVAFLRFVAAMEFAEKIETQKVDEYASIQRAAHWNDVARDMFSVTQACVFIKFWKLLMYTDHRFLTFALTLKLTSSYMMAFVVLLAVLVVATAMSGFVLFGQDMWEFSTWGESMVSLVDLVLGNRFFHRLVTINPILGPVFVFLYCYFVIFIGLNFVVALLDLGVHEAKEVVQQRKVWLTYSRYFKQSLLRSMVFVNLANKQKLSDQLALEDNPVRPSITVHPQRWNGMKMATAQYIRQFLVDSKANKMKEMQRHCNLLLRGTGYRIVSKRQKHLEKDLIKQRHIEQLRNITADFIRTKLGHEMKPKEFKEYADVNKYIVRLRIQKMERTMDKLEDKVEEFVNRFKSKLNKK